MDINSVDKSIEYEFEEALKIGKKNRTVIITSKKDGMSYKIDMLEKNNKLKFFNPIIDDWQVCSYVEPKEIFDKWYVTKQKSESIY